MIKMLALALWVSAITAFAGAAASHWQGLTSRRVPLKARRRFTNIARRG